MTDSKMNIKPSTIFTGDNLPILRGFNSECVDLIYLDPPFNSNANYAAPIGSEAAGAAFKDTWGLSDIDKAWHGELAESNQGLHDFLFAVQAIHSKSMFAYLIYMAIRLLELHRILKPEGSIYLHCDPTASHYLKLLMDTIFDKVNFQNEFIWYYGGGGAGLKRWGKKHDVILFCTKSGKWTFNTDAVRVPHKWKAGQKRADGSERLAKGKIPDDVFIHNSLMPWASETTGYPTQKPLPLLQRIVKASSNRGDVVLDPFCGCATACLAAQAEGRSWIGIDISPMAKKLIVSRFENELKIYKPTIHDRNDIPVRTDLGKIPKYNDKANKNWLYGEQEGKCNGCRILFPYRNMTIDHKVPQSEGGGSDIDNLQLLCGACNSTKGAGSHEKLLVSLKKRGII